MAAASSTKSFRKELKRDLGIRTRCPELYRQAFRHRSALVSGDTRFSNERLEFLGDAILDAIVSEHLFQHYPDADEGFLTQMRSKLVSRQRLNELAEGLNLLRFLDQEVGTEKLKDSGIAGDALEAMVGAYYLDKGFKRTREWVLRSLIGPLDIERLQRTETDPKSRLIEWAQKEGRTLHFQAEADHDQDHRSLLFVDGQEVSQGKGRSKKKAEQEAAQRFLEQKGS
ncbi:MAG: ribonuclease III [Flavobacteriales bacterium]